MIFKRQQKFLGFMRRSQWRVGWMALFGPLSTSVVNGEPAEIIINQLVQEFDGAPKFPLISTNPPELDLSLSIMARSQAELVYQKVAAPTEPSYPSVGLAELPDKALGDVVNLGGSNRHLESVDVTMVNWAKAEDWPALAAENSEGYLHPLTIMVYNVNSDDSLALLDQKTQQVLIPWRPATMDDESEYPYGGLAFTTRFNFDGDILHGSKLAILVAYNTSSGGFEPTGESGPYDALNIGLASSAPLVGTDDNPSKILRYINGIARSGALGANSPIFSVRAFPAEPVPGTPLDAGGYVVKVEVTSAGFENEATAHFELTPLEAELILEGLAQVADGSPKVVTATTIPSGLNYQVHYRELSSPPTERGLYPVFVTLDSPNYVARANATMRLGYSFVSWMAERVAVGDVPAGQDGENDDPDSDGIVNFMEYAEGSNPAVPNLVNGFRIERQNNGQGVKLRFQRNNEATDIRYQLQMTTELGNPARWENVTAPGGRPFIDLEMIDSSFSYRPNVDSVFFRVRYEQNP